MSFGMSRRAAPLLATALCGLVACDAQEAPEVGESAQAITLGYTPPSCSTPGSFACGFREGPIAPDLAAACKNDRWVGYLLSSPFDSCPAARRTPLRGFWRRGKPFAGMPLATMPTEMLRFCVYEWQPRAGYTGGPAIGALPDVAAMRLERDCEAVAPMFTPGPSRAIFEDAYAAQMNLPDVLPTAQFPGTKRTVVAVVDTSPSESTTDLPSPGADGHGLVVGAIARKTSCLTSGGAEVDCAAKIKSYQGMPLGENGTSFGRPIDVALGMARALVQWHNEGRVDNLVINLSLGWDQKFSGVHGPGIRMTALAPWLAAQWAVCERALVIASAGNRSQAGAANGPVFPGGWEQDVRLCPGPVNQYAPLIHAVGAVDGKDETLRIARPGGNPRMLAPGSFATAHAPAPGGGYSRGRLVSGTSVSAAALSGTAALVWTLEPTLSADDVMAEIYRASTFLGDPPDFKNPQGNWVQARVDSCSAAQRVCQAALDNCPINCVKRGPGVDAQPDYEQAFDLEFPGALASPETPGVTITGFPVVPLVEDMLVEPHAGPQPGGTICPLCGIDEDWLVGEFDVPEDTAILDVFLRPKPCSPGWCDEELGGFKIDMPDPYGFFKIDVSDMMDLEVVDSAMLEVTTETDGEIVVRSSELFIK